MLHVLATIAQPPRHLAVPKPADSLFNIFIGIPAVISLVIAVRQVRAGKRPILLAFLVGGLICCLFEPVVDVLGLCYFKERHQLGTFSALGRTMPLFIPFVYTWYVGGLGYLAYRLIAQGLTRRMLFELWALCCVVDIVLETPGLVAGVYTYYGKQPLDIWGFPMWWGFVNPVMPLLAGAIAYRILPHLRGWATLALVAVMPIADGASNGAIAWPVWLTLNQNHASYAWTYLAALVTLVLALFVVWMIGLAVAREETVPGPQTVWRAFAQLRSPTETAAAPAAAGRQEVMA